MSQIPFPGGAADQDVFFHEDKVCVYHKAINTWECRTVNTGSVDAGQPAAVTTQTVYTIPIPTTNGSVKNNTRLISDLRTQYDVNWFIAEKVEELFKSVAFLNQQVAGLSNIFIGEQEPNNDYNQWTFWYNPVSHEFLYWDAEQGLWIEVKTNRPPIFSDTEPTEHPDFAVPENELIAGDVWIDITDPDDLVQYIYDGTDWIKTGGDYVHRKGGDSMEGPLTVTGDRNLDPDTGVQSSIRVLNVDSGQNSSLQLKHNGTSKVYIGSNNTSFQHDIKFAQNNKQVYSGSDTDKKGLAFNSDGVEYFGDYTEDKHVATKKDVEEAIYHDRTDPDTNKYVDRSGDVMDGDLVLEESRLVFRNPVNNQTLIKANRDSGKFPVLLDLVNNNTVGSTLGGYDIKIGGATSYNQLRFVGQDTYLTINGGGGSNTPVKFHKDVDCGNNLFKKLGTPIDETDAANKKYVDDRDELLRQDIIELEEEIDAIAPSVEYGTWVWKNPASLGRPPAEGEFYLLDDAFATTQEYANTKHIVIHDDEYGGTGNHSWLEADPGKLIQLFDAADPDFLLGEITNTDTKDTYVIITVDLIQTNGTPADTVDSETGEFLTRINIFEKPSGGDASGFVLKTGDTMTGNLTIDRSGGSDDIESRLTLTGSRSGKQHAAAAIKFLNDQFNTTSGFLSFRTDGTDTWFTFNRDVDISNQGLQRAGYVQFISNGLIKHNDNDRIKFQSKNTANDGDGLVVFERPPNHGRRGITIRGLHPDDDQETDILWTYTNATGGDAVNYDGKMTGDSNLVNKKYVDDAVASAGSGLPAGGAKGQVLKKDHATGNTQWQGAIDINPDGNNRAKGEMWFNQNDGTLYLKVS